LSSLAKISGEAERLHDWKISLDCEHRCSWTLFLGEDLTTTTIENTVDTANGVLGTLDFDEVDRLLETRGGKQTRGVANTSAGGDELTTTTMDGISVKCYIENVESNTTHVLLSANTFLGRPLECSNARILDFVEVLYTLGNIDQQVRASCVRAKAPDFPGIGDVPSVFVGEDARANLVIVSGTDLAGFDVLGSLFLEGKGDGIETVVLVL